MRMNSRVTGKQHLIFDADDTLWENNIYFEQAFDEFCEYLNHSSLTPEEIRGVLDEIEKETADSRLRRGQLRTQSEPVLSAPRRARG